MQRDSVATPCYADIAMSATPEARARWRIDAQLEAAGWHVQDGADLDLTAGRGVAVREFPMRSGFGTADYLLYVERTVAGAIEAKADGTLAGVEPQSEKYAEGVHEDLPTYGRPLPFLFQSNGAVTYFTNGLDPTPRSREIFNFPRPETLVTWAKQPAQLRARLQELPPLDESRLWDVQARAIRRLEASLARGNRRALIQMATGSGKTFTAVNAAYRLLKYGGAHRILFLVDRGNLGRQTFDEFADFTPPDDARKFPELYTVQRLATNSVNPAAKVVVTTIQRLYSMLRGDAEYDPGNEEDSAFASPAATWQGAPPEVAYTAAVPPEFFDFVIVDECHRSIYDLWSQVLLYFDAFLIGLTATPAGKTIGFFNQNLVMQYGHDEAVIDGVNVDFDVYRIRTRVTDRGATVAADESGVYVDKRNKLTRAERLQLLTDDLTYTAAQLDRDVVSESHIRTVLRQFRDVVLPEAFPGRAEVPKTLIFAKDDSHADDIVRLAREEFAAGNDFCQKITYRTGFTKVVRTVTEDDGTETEGTEWVKTSSLTPEEILTNFRNSFFPRIAVTVDMMSTGTDVKPIECVFFLRNVKSAGFFEQMKGRGVRVIAPDALRAVTPSATVKGPLRHRRRGRRMRAGQDRFPHPQPPAQEDVGAGLAVRRQRRRRPGGADHAGRPPRPFAAGVQPRPACRTLDAGRRQVLPGPRPRSVVCVRPRCTGRGRPIALPGRAAAEETRRSGGQGSGARRGRAVLETDLPPPPAGDPARERADHRPPHHRRGAPCGLRRSRWRRRGPRCGTSAPGSRHTRTN